KKEVQSSPLCGIMELLKSHDTQVKELLRMNNYSTLGHNLKRGIFNYSKKISGGLYRPAQRFVWSVQVHLLRHCRWLG
ncbi:MAG: hypothetical protein FWE98_00770, partial [Oscillospiraceae bacterium]|nr:hypothetical protein [Oscillospiraceae bacterium]